MISATQLHTLSDFLPYLVLLNIEYTCYLLYVSKCINNVNKMNSVTLKIIMVINDPVSDHELFGKKRIALLMSLANLILTGVVFGLLSTTPVTPPRPNKMQGRYLIAGGRSDEGQIEMTEVVELILWRITIYTIWSCWINFWKSWGVQLVMESRTQNPRGTTTTFKSPT